MVHKLLREESEVLGLTTDEKRARIIFSGENAGLMSLLEFDYERTGNIGEVVEDYQPDLIFNFAAKATGQGMFDAPYEINRLNGGFVVDILEALRQSERSEHIVFCQASSSEMYGNVTETPQTEMTPFRPKSPYGAAKLYAHNMVNIYRANYGIKCCSAILYNHESVRRSTAFVTKKIANSAAMIKMGLADSLQLGSLDAQRDWGYAPEYVDAMYRMARAEVVDDYVVATGHLHSVRDLCKAAFDRVGLDYTDYVNSAASQVRATESFNLLGNPEKIRKALGWHAEKTVNEIMVEMVESELKELSS